jgi:hypothetical protein
MQNPGNPLLSKTVDNSNFRGCLFNVSKIDGPAKPVHCNQRTSLRCQNTKCLQKRAPKWKHEQPAFCKNHRKHFILILS